LYEAHLDYHGDRADYVASKWKIQANMTSDDFLILNYNQEECVAVGQTTKATVVPFSTKEKLETGAYYADGTLYYNGEKIIDVTEVNLAGMHNVENMLAAICVAKLKGVSTNAIAEVLRAFGGVEHRMQYIGEFHGRKVYNDSKATNILATEKALDGLDLNKVVLIAGGLDRGNEFDELHDLFTSLKGIVLVGETKHKLERVAREAGVPSIVLSENVETAVPEAFALSAEGDMILLSPANASWDQYPNFETRGDKFVAAVKAY
jgi:UDP-N-acetylmuramoylalanine--D-glutamate ligase